MLGWGILFLPGTSADAGETIRVLILRDVSVMKVSGEGLPFVI